MPTVTPRSSTKMISYIVIVTITFIVIMVILVVPIAVSSDPHPPPPMSVKEKAILISFNDLSSNQTADPSITRVEKYALYVSGIIPSSKILGIHDAVSCKTKIKRNDY